MLMVFLDDHHQQPHEEVATIERDPKIIAHVQDPESMSVHVLPMHSPMTVLQEVKSTALPQQFQDMRDKLVQIGRFYTTSRQIPQCFKQ